MNKLPLKLAARLADLLETQREQIMDAMQGKKTLR